MDCPVCHAKLGTRKTFDAASHTYRVKQCPRCKRYVKTWERADHSRVEAELKDLQRKLRNIRNIVSAK